VYIKLTATGIASDQPNKILCFRKLDSPVEREIVQGYLQNSLQAGIASDQPKQT
jgi:hypothetical protein